MEKMTQRTNTSAGIMEIMILVGVPQSYRLPESNEDNLLQIGRLLYRRDLGKVIAFRSDSASTACAENVIKKASSLEMSFTPMQELSKGYFLDSVAHELIMREAEAQLARTVIVVADQDFCLELAAYTAMKIKRKDIVVQLPLLHRGRSVLVDFTKGKVERSW
ncbi:MAG TPA: hypothetical protein VG694_00885 [Candidatus Paceibacterota bacterium]|nr:hypothetical protein [Candidatus Paceibacterota bacterium]